MLERCGGGFYSSPRESSRWGVRNPDMSESGSDMFGHRLWNSAAKPDKGERPDNAERPDMSVPGARHVRLESLEPSC
jgi:hypothetical protein